MQSALLFEKTAPSGLPHKISAGSRAVVAGNYSIAVVSETLPPDVNGVAMTMGRLIEQINANDHLLSLVYPRPTRTYDDKTSNPVLDSATHNIRVAGVPIPFYRMMQFGMPATKRLLRHWQFNRPDIVHIVTEGPLGLSALIAAKRLSIPVVSGFHTNFHQYAKHYKLGFIEPCIMAYLRWFHNKADVTLVPTRELAYLLQTKGINNARVLSRGVDTTQFNPSHRSEALRRSWGVKNNDPVVIHVGRLAAEKNMDLVLKAFEKFRAVQNSARLVLIGDGPLRTKVERHPSSPIVTGSLSGQALSEGYASADIFFFPSRSETFGNVTLEAMASGLGVVAFDYAAAKELIKDGENGMLASFESDSAFLQKALKLAQEPNSVARLGAQARDSVTHIDWSNIYHDLVSIYNDVS